jgi:flagellum-specific peptidoglycan hydrolase FlgJ
MNSGFKTKPSIPAEEILNDKTVLKKFTEIYNAKPGGKALISAKDFLELCQIYMVDPCLALAQGIIESRLGTRCLAVKTMNITNVGNTEDRRIRSFNSFSEGKIAYLETMQKYFVTTREEFSERNGRNLRGAVYATSRGYMKEVKDLAKKKNQQA